MTENDKLVHSDQGSRRDPTAEKPKKDPSPKKNPESKEVKKEESRPEPEPEKTSGGVGILIAGFSVLILAVLLGIGWAAFTQVTKNDRKQVAARKPTAQTMVVAENWWQPIEIPVVDVGNAKKIFAEPIILPPGNNSCVHWKVPAQFEPFLLVRLDQDGIYKGATHELPGFMQAELNIVIPPDSELSSTREVVTGRYSIYRC
jgi:hypothetical protein